MDAALRPQRWERQEIGLLKPMEELATFPATVSGAAPARSPVAAEKKARPQKEQARSCPRCNSKHTKFCYYNNYSLSQPRHFCKTCRRYWTDGGSLRNVPVGGGSRKNKRSTITTTTDITGRNHEGQVHQNLAVPEYPNQYLTFYNNDSFDHRLLSGMAARDIGSLRFGSSTSTTLPPLEFPSGFDGLTFTPPKLNISADARLLFPFDDLKPEIPSTAAAAADHQHTSFWNAMIHRSGSSSYQMNS